MALVENSYEQLLINFTNEKLVSVSTESRMTC